MFNCCNHLRSVLPCHAVRHSRFLCNQTCEEGRFYSGAISYSFTAFGRTTAKGGGRGGGGRVEKSQLKPDEGGDEEYGTAEGQGVKEMEDAKCSQGAPVKGNSICWVGFSTYSAKRLKGPWFCPMDIHRPKELSLLEIKYSVLRSFISHPNGCYKLDQINMKFT